MDCYVCFCDEDANIKCSRFNCTATICIDCINRMVQFCHSNFKSFPSCNCGAEYLHSQIKNVLTEENNTLYADICAKRIDELKEQSEQTREKRSIKKERNKRIMDEFFRESKTKLLFLAPAISRLIEISGLDVKMWRKNANKILAILSRNTEIKCISFACKGIMFDDDENCFVCSKCSIKACRKCKHVFGQNHECRADELKSIDALKQIAKCPKCGVPAVKGEGCIFVTCPFCNVNFDSKTGKPTPAGGHNTGTLVMKKTVSIADVTDDKDLKPLLVKLENQKPTTKYWKHSSNSAKYERMVCSKLYRECINLVYEYMDSGKLTREVLEDMLVYASHLTT